MIKGTVMLYCACKMGNDQSEVYLIFVLLYGAVYLWKMKVLAADRFPGALFSCPLLCQVCARHVKVLRSPSVPLVLGLRKAKVSLYLLLPGVLYVGWDLYLNFSWFLFRNHFHGNPAWHYKTLMSNCGICSYYYSVNCSVQPELEKLVLDAALYGRMGRCSLCSTPNNDSNIKPYVCGRAAAVASACVTRDTRSQ